MNNLSVFYDHILEAERQTREKGAEVPVPQILKRCAEWGISAMEINSATLAESADSVLPMLADAGFAISGICHKHDFVKFPGGTGGSAGSYASLEEEAQAVMEMAHKAGSITVLIVAGFLSEEDAREINARHWSYAETAEWMERSDAIRRVQKGLETFCRAAEPYGIRIVVEDFDNWTSPTAMLYENLWFMKNVPGLHFALDTGNFAYSSEDVLKAYEVLLPYISHIHCKDRAVNASAPDTDLRKYIAACAVGEGYIPIRAIVDKEKARAYDDFYVIEHYGLQDQLEGIRRSAEYMRSIL